VGLGRDRRSAGGSSSGGLPDVALKWGGGGRLASVACEDRRVVPMVADCHVSHYCRGRGVRFASDLRVDRRVVPPVVAGCQVSRWRRLCAIGRVAIKSLIRDRHGSSIDDPDDMFGEFTLASLRTHIRSRGLLHGAPLPCNVCLLS